MKNLAVIIVHYGSPKITESCIASINKSTYEFLKIIVVNNSDTSLENEKFPDTMIVNSEKNLGYAGGCNLGIKKAIEMNIHDFVLCNNDVIFPENFFLEFIQNISKINGVCMVAPKILSWKQPYKIWFNGGRINKFTMEVIHDTKNSEKGIKKTNFINGCCFYLSKMVIDKIGYMDDKFHLYYEDIDFCLRAQENLIGLYVVDTAIVYHNISTSTRSNRKWSYYNIDIYYSLLRNKKKIINRFSNFPLKCFAMVYLYYKFTKYLVLFIVEQEYRNINKLLKAIKD